MPNYIYDPTSGELYHYGVKGMKWGVRRYQDKNGRLTAAGKKRYSDDDSKKSDEEESAKRKGLTDKQKKAIKIGAAVVATGLAVYGGYKFHQLYTGAGSKIDPATGFRLLDKDLTDDQNMLAVNPGRVRLLSKRKNLEIIDGSSANCMLCTTAYDLRKRGYDVHAGFSTTGFLPDNLFPKIYSDYKGTDKIYTFDKPATAKLDTVSNYVKRQPPGSRGNIMVWWKGYGAGGHSMIWENVDGNVVFRDGQTNEVYKDFTKILKNISDDKPIEMLRTDNLTINPKGMKPYINTDTVVKTYVDHGGEIALKAANDPVIQTVATVGVYAGATVYSRKAAVKSYKQQHPNTKLSDKEILQMLTEGGSG